jgi:3-hydroxy-9,10-secoandrosta-1,3,5(10)-triene-9,17-dione monooxygenase reductase component
VSAHIAVAETTAAFDSALFRHVVGHFCTGVAVAASLHDDQPVGFTIQSFTSVSLHPPLILICAAKSSASWPSMRASGAFCVTILCDEQETVSRAFAAKGRARFTDIEWRRAPVTGSPVLNDALAWVDCRIRVEHDAGDHVIAIGQVVDLDARRHGQPLLFYQGGYRRIG